MILMQSNFAIVALDTVALNSCAYQYQLPSPNIGNIGTTQAIWQKKSGSRYATLHASIYINFQLVLMMAADNWKRSSKGHRGPGFLGKLDRKEDK